MTAQDVIDVLKTEGHYHQRLPEVHVANEHLSFDFDALLVGPGDQDGLVLVAEVTADRTLAKVRCTLGALVGVLERCECRRPLALVLIANDDRDAELESLRRLCRLIIAPPARAPEEALVGLLPLPRIDPIEPAMRAEEALVEALKEDVESPLVQALIEAARSSSDQVEQTMREHVSSAARRAYEEDGDSS